MHEFIFDFVYSLSENGTEVDGDECCVLFFVFYRKINITEKGELENQRIRQMHGGGTIKTRQEQV